MNNQCLPLRNARDPENFPEFLFPTDVAIVK
jgi:hypothetical protein